MSRTNRSADASGRWNYLETSDHADRCPLGHLRISTGQFTADRRTRHLFRQWLAAQRWLGSEAFQRDPDQIDARRTGALRRSRDHCPCNSIPLSLPCFMSPARSTRVSKSPICCSWANTSIWSSHVVPMI